MSKRKASTLPSNEGTKPGKSSFSQAEVDEASLALGRLKPTIVFSRLQTMKMLDVSIREAMTRGVLQADIVKELGGHGIVVSASRFVTLRRKAGGARQGAAAPSVAVTRSGEEVPPKADEGSTSQAEPPGSGDGESDAASVDVGLTPRHTEDGRAEFENAELRPAMRLPTSLDATGSVVDVSRPPADALFEREGVDGGS